MGEKIIVSYNCRHDTFNTDDKSGELNNGIRAEVKDENVIFSKEGKQLAQVPLKLFKDHPGDEYVVLGDTFAFDPKEHIFYKGTKDNKSVSLAKYFEGRCTSHTKLKFYFNEAIEPSVPNPNDKEPAKSDAGKKKELEELIKQIPDSYSKKQDIIEWAREWELKKSTGYVIGVLKEAMPKIKEDVVNNLIVEIEGILGPDFLSKAKQMELAELQTFLDRVRPKLEELYQQIGTPTLNWQYRSYDKYTALKTTFVDANDILLLRNDLKDLAESQVNNIVEQFSATSEPKSIEELEQQSKKVSGLIEGCKGWLDKAKGYREFQEYSKNFNNGIAALETTLTEINTEKEKMKLKESIKSDTAKKKELEELIKIIPDDDPIKREKKQKIREWADEWLKKEGYDYVIGLLIKAMPKLVPTAPSPKVEPEPQPQPQPQPVPTKTVEPKGLEEKPAVAVVEPKPKPEEPEVKEDFGMATIKPGTPEDKVLQAQLAVQRMMSMEGDPNNYKNLLDHAKKEEIKTLDTHLKKINTKLVALNNLYNKLTETAKNEFGWQIEELSSLHKEAKRIVRLREEMPNRAKGFKSAFATISREVDKVIAKKITDEKKREIIYKLDEQFDGKKDEYIIWAKEIEEYSEVAIYAHMGFVVTSLDNKIEFYKVILNDCYNLLTNSKKEGIFDRWLGAKINISEGEEFDPQKDDETLAMVGSIKARFDSKVNANDYKEAERILAVWTKLRTVMTAAINKNFIPEGDRTFQDMKEAMDRIRPKEPGEAPTIIDHQAKIKQAIVKEEKILNGLIKDAEKMKINTEMGLGLFYAKLGNISTEYDSWVESGETLDKNFEGRPEVTTIKDKIDALRNRLTGGKAGITVPKTVERLTTEIIGEALPGMQTTEKIGEIKQAINRSASSSGLLKLYAQYERLTDLSGITTATDLMNRLSALDKLGNQANKPYKSFKRILPQNIGLTKIYEDTIKLSKPIKDIAFDPATKNDIIKKKNELNKLIKGVKNESDVKKLRQKLGEIGEAYSHWIGLDSRLETTKEAVRLKKGIIDIKITLLTIDKFDLTDKCTQFKGNNSIDDKAFSISEEAYNNFRRSIQKAVNSLLASNPDNKKIDKTLKELENNYDILNGTTKELQMFNSAAGFKPTKDNKESVDLLKTLRATSKTALPRLPVQLRNFLRSIYFRTTNLSPASIKKRAKAIVAVLNEGLTKVKITTGPEANNQSRGVSKEVGAYVIIVHPSGASETNVKKSEVYIIAHDCCALASHNKTCKFPGKVGSNEVIVEIALLTVNSKKKAGFNREKNEAEIKDIYIEHSDKVKIITHELNQRGIK